MCGDATRVVNFTNMCKCSFWWLLWSLKSAYFCDLSCSRNHRETFIPYWMARFLFPSKCDPWIDLSLRPLLYVLCQKSGANLQAPNMYFELLNCLLQYRQELTYILRVAFPPIHYGTQLMPSVVFLLKCWWHEHVW